MDEFVKELAELVGALRTGAETWWTSLPTSEFAEPLSVFLFCSAALAGIVSGRLSILLGAAIWAALGVCLTAAQPPDARLFVAGAIASAHGLLLLGAYTYRIHLERLLNGTRALEARNRELQADLDREILWRRAADAG